MKGRLMVRCGNLTLGPGNDHDLYGGLGQVIIVKGLALEDKEAAMGLVPMLSLSN